jgi:hypothetical protein
MKPRHSLLLAGLLLAGCNSAPLDYTPVGDMKPGPGMFSGASGSFSLSGKTPKPAEAPNVDE